MSKGEAHEDHVFFPLPTESVILTRAVSVRWWEQGLIGVGLREKGKEIGERK